MYTPIQPGIPIQHTRDTSYQQYVPSKHIADLVQCFWTLRTQKPLEGDFRYLILPDGCVDIVFDVGATPHSDGALVMTPGTTAVRVNLGRSFSYIGIRLRPGTWQASLNGIVGDATDIDHLALCDLRRIRQRLATSTKNQQLQILEHLVVRLTRQGVLGTDAFTAILSSLQAMPVEELTPTTGYSTRQLRRRFRHSTGYSPREYLAIIRFQHALQQQTFEAYADQSHFIRECKRITGMTPATFRTSYTGMAGISNP